MPENFDPKKVGQKAKPKTKNQLGTKKRSSDTTTVTGEE
jgi:hypothetical protein